MPPADDLILIIPGAIAAAVLGLIAYRVKKVSKERERIARAHQPPSERSQKPNGG